MADGLVGLQPHHARQEDDCPIILRTLLCHQHLIQFLHDAVGFCGKDLAVYRFPATCAGTIAAH